MVEQVLLVEDFLFVHQHAEQRGLPFGARLQQFEQAFVGGREVLHLDQIGFDQGSAQQAVGPHQQCPVFRHFSAIIASDLGQRRLLFAGAPGQHPV